MTDTKSDSDLVFRILDGLHDGMVDTEALQQLVELVFTSADAGDYFKALCADPILRDACQNAIATYRESLLTQQQTLNTALQEKQSSLEEVRSLLSHMQRIPAVVSRDLLKQMVLLVLMQHGAKEAV